MTFLCSERFEAAGMIVNESRLVLSASSLFSVNVTGLLPFSRYAAIVTAFTSAGSANSSLSNFVTTAEAGENSSDDKKSKTMFDGFDGFDGRFYIPVYSKISEPF